MNLLAKRKVRTIFSLEAEETKEIKAEDNLIRSIEISEKLEKVKKVLKTLPAKQKEVFIMRNFEELSYEEISEITETTVGSLKANYHHAVKKIENFIKHD